MIAHNTAYNGAPIISWLIHLGFRYPQILAIKTYSTDIAAFVLGVMVTTFFAALILKNTRFMPNEDSSSDDINITRMKKKSNKWIIISGTSQELFHLPLTTATILFCKIAIVRIFPFVKSLQLVDKRKVRVWVSVITVLIAFLCFFFLTMDQHVILPTSNGNYVVKDIHDLK